MLQPRFRYAVVWIFALTGGAFLGTASAPSALAATPRVHSKVGLCPAWGTCDPTGLAIWTDKSSYALGDQVTICYAVPSPGYFAIFLRRPSDGSLITSGQDDGTGGCFVGGTTALPAGARTITIFFWGNGYNASAAPSFAAAQSSAEQSADNTYTVHNGLSCAPNCAAKISTDRSQYAVGDAIQICFSVPAPSHVTITLYRSDGTSSITYDQDDDGTGGCVPGSVGPPAGGRRLHMDVTQGGTLIAKAETTYSVIAAPQPVPTPTPIPTPISSPAVPDGRWISPADGTQIQDSVHFSAHAHPSHAGDPPIGHVDFTLWWPALGPKSGPWKTACSLSSPSTGDVYQCDVKLSDLGAPVGQISVSFDVYDAQYDPQHREKGHFKLSPDNERTITYSPPSPVQAFRCPSAAFYFPYASGTTNWLYKDSDPAVAQKDKFNVPVNGVIYHTGVDFFPTSNNPQATVYAPASGTVSDVNQGRTSINIDTDPGQPDNIDIYITHLSPIDPGISSGTVTHVTAGVTPLGKVDTGEDHVHISIGPTGMQHHSDLDILQTQDPSPYFQARLVADNTLGTHGSQPDVSFSLFCANVPLIDSSGPGPLIPGPAVSVPAAASSPTVILDLAKVTVRVGKTQQVNVSTNPGASVRIVVRFPNGSTKGNTGDADGDGSYTWSFKQPKGKTSRSNHTVKVTVWATVGGQTVSDSGTYKIK